MWADEAGWRIQSRCKVCPDALGEAADLAAADIWPGAVPEGEDDGFNGVITRTGRGERLYQAASEAGDLCRGKPISPGAFNSFQPHQVNKKHALAARLRGMQAAGVPVYAHDDRLRIAALDAGDKEEEAGTFDRVRRGRFHEDLPRIDRQDARDAKGASDMRVGDKSNGAGKRRAGAEGPRTAER